LLDVIEAKPELLAEVLGCQSPLVNPTAQRLRVELEQLGRFFEGVSGSSEF
jgi:hypothetical protein